MRSPLFTALSPSDRRAVRASYLEYLRRRDGTPDRTTHRFDVRERFFARIDAEPVRWRGAPRASQALFDRLHAAWDPGACADEVTLWALCVAKANRAEKYGVEYAHAHRPASPADADDPLSYVETEEFYHTRILRDALAVIGLRMEVSDPPRIQRLLIHAMVKLPDAIADVLVYCGEITGVVLFRRLLDKARLLFAAEPEALARIEELFAQIMVDEVGHVHFVRTRLDQWGLSAARRMLPLVARSVGDGMPELWTLLDRDAFVAEVVRADVDGAAAGYDDRFVWTAALA